MTSDELKTAATGFLPGAVVGATIVWLAMSMAPSPTVVPVTLPSDTQDSKQTGTQDDSASQSENPAADGNARLHAEDQPAGRAVVVKRVQLDATSWVAVRDYSDGAIGNVLGAVRRDAGASDNVIVDLLRSTEPGKQYAVVLFTDDGDGKFDTKRDSPVLTGDAVQRAIITAQTPVAPNGR